MRLTSIAHGRGTPAENTRMASEKVGAFLKAATTLATGGSDTKWFAATGNMFGLNGRRLRQRS